MLKILLKKQIAEVFKGYFYDAKRNKKRSKKAVILWFVFFAVLMIGVLGGMFTALSLSLCEGLVSAGVGWLYFALLGGLAIVLGAFGSVFNSYSALYMSKDNDLLLSLPIPVRDIIASRLINVYLLGAMYSAVVIIPALIVYWVTARPNAVTVICGLLLILVITSIVLILSCLLGWVVAKISLKLKHKSFTTVFFSLLFIVVYYIVYFKASSLIRDIIANAAIYGMKVKGAAYGLYLFGRIGEGSLPAALIFTGIAVVLLLLTWYVMSRSFISIATASGVTEKVKYKEKMAKERTAFGAFLGKELARFTSNPNYMLNCGLGVLLIPAAGVLLLIKGRYVANLLDDVFVARPGSACILLCTGLCMMATLCNMAVPSVSLEGKSIWIPQSLPVEPKTVLRAKAGLQLLLSGIPMIFAVICGAAVLDVPVSVRILIALLPLAYTVVYALFCLFLGVKMPNLTWTNEIMPIKQSGAVVVSLFGTWGVEIAFAGLYLLVGYRLGVTVYLAIWTVVFACAAVFLFRWMETKGSRIFAEL